MKIRVGTRGSPLALIQTRAVIEKIKRVDPAVETEIVVIKTAGDMGKRKLGAFVNEINRAVLNGVVDIGVHSLKDLPVALPSGLELICIPERLPPNDALVSKEGLDFWSLPEGAVIGTSSMRRKLELKSLRPDLEFVDIRGNINTRIEKMEDGVCDAIVVGLAALRRLGFERKVSTVFDFDEVVPAAGQGAVAVTAREKDIPEIVREINEKISMQETSLEREVLRKMGGGCRSGVGVVCQKRGRKWHLWVAFHRRGRRVLKIAARNPAELAGKVGEML